MLPVDGQQGSLAQAAAGGKQVEHEAESELAEEEPIQMSS
jgi:hypothetical protein